MLALSALLRGAALAGQNTPPPAAGKAAPLKPGTSRAVPPSSPGGKPSANTSLPLNGPGYPAPPIAPPPGLPAGPPLPPPPTLPRRVSLVGAVPPAMQAQSASLDVDASNIEGVVPVLWRGAAYGTVAPSRPDASSTGLSRRLSQLRKASGAHLARLNPLAPGGVVTPGADGVPVVQWDVVDAALRGAAQRQEEVIFGIQPPPAWSESAWNALIAMTLRRYQTNAPASILRWELRGDAALVAARYAPFARQSRALFPAAPVGVYLTRGDVGEGTRRVAQICGVERVPLDSLAWRLPSDAAEAADSAQRVRAALSAYPALKGTLLLPTLAVPRAPEDTGNDAARVVTLCARLMEAAPAALPNSLGGVLLEDDSANGANGADDGDHSDGGNGGENAGAQSGTTITAADMTLQAATALGLLNRMTGTRLGVRSAGAGVNCLASQAGAHTFVLLWRAADTARAAPASNTLALVRLHHLAQTETGLRITRSATSDASFASVSSNASSSSSGDANANGSSGRMTADIAPTGSYLPGDLELTTLLAPGEACLLDVAPLGPSAVLQTTLSVNGAALRGGDPFEVVLSARNLSANARALNAVLTSSLPDVLPQASVRLALGTLPAGGTRAFRFTLRAPVVASSGTLTLGAQTGDAHALVTLPILPALEADLESPRADVFGNGNTATLRARLINRGRAPLNARVQAGDGTPVAVTVLPDGRPHVISLPVALPVSASGLYPIRVRVESGGRTLQSLTAHIGIPFACPRAQATPAIDGDLSEWTGDAPLGMGRAEQAHGKAWGGPSDISAYAYTRWDARYFYFACAVTDDMFVPPRSASALEQGDSVFVALSANGGAGGSLVAPLNGSGNSSGSGVANGSRTAGSGAGGQTRNEPQAAVFGLALLQNAKGGLEPTLVRLSRPSGAAGRTVAESVRDGRVAIRREGSRVFYEAAIPWTRILNSAPQSGQTLGLSILVNDTDGASGAGKAQSLRRGYMEWGGGLAGRVQPLLFPPLRLTK